jgi:hypothetical protein
MITSNCAHQTCYRATSTNRLIGMEYDMLMLVFLYTRLFGYIQVDIKYRNEKDWWWGLGPETARSVMESNRYEVGVYK